MALKRKLSIDFEDVEASTTPKQPRLLVPFPNTQFEMDVNMSDEPVMELAPLSIPTQMFHTRLSSNASSASYSSYDSPRSSPLYPTFELYPHDEAQDQMAVDAGNYFDRAAESSPKPVGLIQPKGTLFTHHGQHCSQIPKLRMACSAGPNGQRSMWAHCEQCGAIEMVDTD